MAAPSVERVLTSWSLTGEPIRPSNDELHHFRRRLAERSAPKILILGLTPELVDLALDLMPTRTSVMEIRQVAVEALRHLRGRDWSSVEFLLDDWRHQHQGLRESFDAVLGHGSLVLLAFPQDWLTTLKNVHDFLVPGGLLILRTFHMPSGGHPFEVNYARLLREFEAAILGAPDESRLRQLVQTISEIRCTAILAATRDCGSVDHETLARVNDWIRQDLGSRFGTQEVWKVLGPEFDIPTAAGYEGLWPKAAPTWEMAREVIAASGFSVQIDFVGTRPGPGCFQVVSARKGQ